ncbi:MAG TPA: UbiH/UbiF family hydroxylase [Nitrosospira sp.]|jgi:ubiquinone biosynthesis UbiH/UbiF/VisC/COQ6 family hydroxylase
MKFDVVIVGGGLVGASLALALKESDLRIALVEPRLPSPLPDGDSWDARIYAISTGSARFLQDCGAWQELDETRLAPVHEMAVFGDDPAARLDFSAYDIGSAELAFIAENRQLQNAVWKALNRQKKHIRIYCPLQCAAVTWTDSYAEIQLTDGNIVQAALVVGADGLNSWVREQAAIETSRQSYQQTGVVANFKVEHRHRNIAYQWFRRDGVLALLPLPDAMVSMVWSANEERAKTLLGLPETELCQEVAEASFRTLGELQLVTQPAAFPLNFLHVKSLVRPRLALIGDAAHGIHPLAGQGVNLGLRDARELATILSERGMQPDCGDFLLLRRYERARREDIFAMEMATDGLHKLFQNANPTLIRWRNLGLGITDRLPFIKKALMQHALH